ncbi:1-deoxy-D-xylulose-5-phosphate synthase [Actinoplanes xinjiangensis]|uniref:1-deoxy-D-xylulose-5-phosphate synthase n=1 Tax=Actinoplanes xinjiangensis TaxID=512350 RepID=A0A316EVI8_9ACTN|nr:1-deoxy-D-xylulose-5-phosphate synthase [Actinoplanes xinjiangensis]PWK36022.1 1-deoxy-D-xylulose-5-phosphate synthase [Actinoplanes xinjiangensis]GIF42980.1 1-deoxy-D-xylulose-5-phosphate synthase 2 [Actinoplanes xinjiangensis]
MLQSIRSPADARAVPAEQVPVLAAEIRRLLIDKVGRRGGHLGPNLGVVELTLALHRVFESPRDRILWDTGHQAYVHKLLTGRVGEFDRLRLRGGLSGYPSRTESEHDIIENSHASTVLSWAYGLATGYRLQGVSDRAVVAVIGDGALTGGMAWEALNNISAADDIPVIIVVNDNGRSYSPTVGGLAGHLAAIRTARGFERFLDGDTTAIPSSTPSLDDPPETFFESLGLTYIGPIDGHDVAAVEDALRSAVRAGGPVLVHCLTRKGNGYAPAENDTADRFHAIAAVDPDLGCPLPAPAPSWTSAFGEELARLGDRHPEVVAITAAMLRPTGLAAFAQRFPERVLDVGIAEQHAVTSAAGLALSGMRPVVAVYSTFLNRAFDQVLMDVALHRAPVTFVLDRAGITGDDGPSHNGMWDIALLNLVPGLRIAAPRDRHTLRAALEESLAEQHGPCVVRFPKGAVADMIPAIAQHENVDILRHGPRPEVLIVSVGPMAGLCLGLAERLEELGMSATVTDPRWIKPVRHGVMSLARRHRLVISVEDGIEGGGFGSLLVRRLHDEGLTVPVITFGIPTRFLDHGSRNEVLAECGLTVENITRAITRHTAGLEPVGAP